MLSVDQAAYSALEAKLSAFLKKQLPGLRMVTMSVIEDKVSLNYLYRKRAGFDWAAFTSELNKMAGKTKVEMFIG
jgi:hypothetical protein